MDEANFIKEYQPVIFKQIQRSFKHGRLAHAYIFEGATGTGTKECGVFIAKRLLCSQLVDDLPCNVCNNCLRIENNEHPDVLVIAPQGQSIKAQQIKSLKIELSKSGMESVKKIVLIHQAEKMGISAANSLLKLIEEPEGESFLCLETKALNKILPTIQSRCQILHFKSYHKNKFIVALTKKNISQHKAELLSNLTNDLDKAVEISQNEWFNESIVIAKQWVDYLDKNDLQAFIYVQKSIVRSFKEKEQQELFFDLVIVYFRLLLNQSITMVKKQQAVEKQAQKIKLVLQAKKKFEMNVSFQNVCEQLVIRIVCLDNR